MNSEVKKVESGRGKEKELLSISVKFYVPNLWVPRSKRKYGEVQKPKGITMVEGLH